MAANAPANNFGFIPDSTPQMAAPAANDFGFVPDQQQITPVSQAPVSPGFLGLNQLSAVSPLSSPIGNHPIDDVNAGISKFKTGLINTYNRLTGQPLQPNPSMSAYMGAMGDKNPSMTDQAIAGLSQFAPYGVAGEAAGGGLAVQSGANALYGATQSSTPLQSAIINALLPPGIKYGGDLITSGVPAIKNAAGNFILNKLNKSAVNAGALSPEETAQNLVSNYTDASGNQLPVDIGTLTNNPLLKKTYSALKYSPFSGVATQMNTVNNGLADKAISNSYNQYISALGDTSNVPLQQQLASTLQEQSKLNNTLQNTPSFFNSLADGVENRANMTGELKGAVQGQFKANMKTSKANYAPINNSNLRLDQLSNGTLFPNYQSAASELLANKENLGNLFDNESDLGSKLNGEVNKAQGLISNSSNWGVTLPEAVTRIQTLGQLAASATSRGNRNEGRLLGNLGQGLSSDVDNILRQSGNEDIANQLQRANSYHKNNVVPFYANTQIRKAATDNNYIPAGAKLASALHDPNNQTILNQLSPNTQNAALYQMMTGGKGTSQGLSNMTPEAIAKKYQGLPVDAKTMVAQYNPQADQLFENLPSVVDRNNQLNSLSQSLSKQLESTQSAQSANIGNLKEQLAKAQNQKFGLNNESSAGDDWKAKGARAAEIGGAALAAHYLSPFTLGATVPAAMFARSLAKTLTNPDLIQAYINRTQLPGLQSSVLSSALARALPPFMAPQINNSNGGQ